MRFLLGNVVPDANIDEAAERYIRYMAMIGEYRWHPRLYERQTVLGIEHLVSARERGHGVVLNFMHHGLFHGAFGAIRNLGVPIDVVIHPHHFATDAPQWAKQQREVMRRGGAVHDVSIGFDGILALLRTGKVVALASDMAGRTPVTFMERRVLGISGAARAAFIADSPVVVMTSHLETRSVQLGAPLLSSDFASPSSLLDELLRQHEQAILAEPWATERPLKHWGFED